MGEKSRRPGRTERPIPAEVYPVIDTDLGRDNVENDMTAADLEDMRSTPHPDMGTVR